MRTRIAKLLRIVLFLGGVWWVYLWSQTLGQQAPTLIVETNRTIPQSETPVWGDEFAGMPTLIEIHGSICSRSVDAECAEPDGIFRTGELPVIHKDAAALTLLQVDQLGNPKPNARRGGYRAVVICDDSRCTQPVEIGSRGAVCRAPKYWFWTNSFRRIGPMWLADDFSDFRGQFTWKPHPGHPDAVAACAANPDAKFVSLSPAVVGQLANNSQGGNHIN